MNSKEFIVLNGDTIQVKISDFINKSTLKDNAVICIGCSKLIMMIQENYH